MCFRTLDLYTSAVLESALNPTRPPKPEFRTAMDAMSKARPRLCTFVSWSACTCALLE